MTTYSRRAFLKRSSTLATTAAASRLFRLRCKDYFEVRKIVRSIPSCRVLKEVQDELRLPSCIVSG